MSTKIMGQAQASIEQMRAYIKKSKSKSAGECPCYDTTVYHRGRA